MNHEPMTKISMFPISLAAITIWIFIWAVSFWHTFDLCVQLGAYLPTITFVILFIVPPLYFFFRVW